jgi:hypothetical protein
MFGVAVTAVAGIALASGAVLAKVPQEVADALIKGDNSPLTPNGAIRAGNEDGSIGPWEPLQTPPSNYKPTNGPWPYANPYADEKPLFTITAQNYQQYQDKLSPGQIEMLTRYPDTYKMDIYPTHRSWAAPDWIYQANLTNATTVELSKSGNDPDNYSGATCFPIPNAGSEMRLNSASLRCMYLTEGIHFYDNVAVVDVSGSWVNAQIEEWHSFPQHDPDQFGKVQPIWKLFQTIQAPPRLAGTTTLVLADVNYERAGGQERIWQYNPGQRRVRRAPQIQFDYPKNGSNGLMTVDQAACDGLGNIIRYNWTLVGRKEMYVPYNNYKMSDQSLSEADIFKSNHIDQDLTRYELHRVWEVVGEQKPEYHMAIDRRVHHYDEDSWYSVMTDMYDQFGNLWRFSECATMTYYDVPVFMTNLDIKYDFSSRAYIVVGVDQGSRAAKTFNRDIDEQMFSVGNMKGTGIR